MEPIEKSYIDQLNKSEDDFYKEGNIFLRDYPSIEQENNETSFKILMKGTNLGHLVKKMITVHNPNTGKTFQAWRWVNPETQESEQHSQPSRYHEETQQVLSDEGVEAAVTSIILNSSGKADKLRDLINLGIYDPKILMLISGAQPVQIYSAIQQADIDVKSLKDKSNLAKNVIRTAQEHNNTPEEREENPVIQRLCSVDEMWDGYEIALDAVAKNRARLVIAYGSGGVGKTHQMEKMVEKHQLREYNNEVKPDKSQYDYVRIGGGRMAPTEVYNTMYRHNGKIIVIDDCDSAIAEESVQGWWKGALDSGEKPIAITNGSKVQAKIDPDEQDTKDHRAPRIPPSFVFTGKIIVITNLGAKDIEQAVRTRARACDLTMTKDETLDMIERKIIPNLKIFNADKTEKLEFSEELKKNVFQLLKQNKDKFDFGALNPRAYGNALIIADDFNQMGKPYEKHVLKYFQDISTAPDAHAQQTGWVHGENLYSLPPEEVKKSLNVLGVDVLEKGGVGSGRKTIEGGSLTEHFSGENLRHVSNMSEGESSIVAHKDGKDYNVIHLGGKKHFQTSKGDTRKFEIVPVK